MTNMTISNIPGHIPSIYSTRSILHVIIIREELHKGSVVVTRAFLPDLRKYAGRVPVCGLVLAEVGEESLPFEHVAQVAPTTQEPGEEDAFQDAQDQPERELATAETHRHFTCKTQGQKVNVLFS